MSLFLKLSRKMPDPRAVQKALRELPYNWEKNGPSLRSAQAAWARKRAHCLEAAFLSAAILEHQGHPPLVLSLESQDDLDHVVYLFKEKDRWGSIGRSRDEGLHGRAPIFRSIEELASSYMNPYVDLTGRITGYAVAHLDDSKADWRKSSHHVWETERYLIRLKHHPLKASEAAHQKALTRFQTHGFHPRKSYWW